MDEREDWELHYGPTRRKCPACGKWGMAIPNWADANDGVFHSPHTTGEKYRRLCILPRPKEDEIVPVELKVMVPVKAWASLEAMPDGTAHVNQVTEQGEFIKTLIKLQVQPDGQVTTTVVN